MNIRAMKRNEREAIAILLFMVGLSAVFASVALPFGAALVAAGCGSALGFIGAALS